MSVSSRKTGPINQNPTKQSVKFGEVFINISAIARDTGIDASWISRILSGKRTVSVAHARAISKALDQGLEEFLINLKRHHRVLIARRPRRKRAAIETQVITTAISAN